MVLISPNLISFLIMFLTLTSLSLASLVNVRVCGTDNFTGITFENVYTGQFLFDGVVGVLLGVCVPWQIIMGNGATVGVAGASMILPVRTVLTEDLAALGDWVVEHHYKETIYI